MKHSENPGGMGNQLPQPGQLWSLFDLMKAVFLDAYIQLGEWFADVDLIYENDPWYPEGGEERKRVSRLFNAMVSSCEAFGLASYAASFRELENDPPNANETYFFARKQFMDLFERRRALFISDEGQKYLRNEDLFGEKVNEAFPSAVPEIRDAGSCFALGLHTAAVFHVMRALEVPLVALAREFGIIQFNNWNTALNDVENAVRNRDNSKSRPKWSDEADYFTDMVTHLFLVKNAWRNYTMHLHLRHTGEEAEEIMRAARGFMQRAAKRLKEVG